MSANTVTGWFLLAALCVCSTALAFDRYRDYQRIEELKAQLQQSNEIGLRLFQENLQLRQFLRQQGTPTPRLRESKDKDA